VDEAKRLINASAPDFRVLVQGGLMTGCRAGELMRARAMDFDRTSETLLVPDSKSGMPRRAQLTPEGVSLLESLTAGAPGNQLIFVRADGSAWGRMPIARGMKAACIAGNISPPATFHALRHTFASHLVQNGVPLLLVASALGHQGTRMVEKHYGHFAPSAAHQMLREKLPAFGMEVNSNVRVLRSNRAAVLPTSGQTDGASSGHG
jgi:integrase